MTSKIYKYISVAPTLASSWRLIDLYAFPVLLWIAASCDIISSVFFSSAGSEFIFPIAYKGDKDILCYIKLEYLFYWTLA